MSDEVLQVNKLQIGSIVSRSFRVMFSNLPAFMFVAVLLGLIPLIFQLVLGGTAALDPIQMERTMGSSAMVLAVLTGLLSFVLNYVIQGAVVYGAVRSLDELQTSFRESVGRGLTLALPLLGISIIYSLGMLVSMALLLVPVFIFICVYFVVIPAAVIDRRGVFGSFSRSADLTRGHRWRIFGLCVVMFLIMFAVTAGFGFIIALIIGFAGLTMEAFLTQALLEVVINALIMVFSACLVSVVYYDLRHFEGGTDLSRLSAVFD